MKGILGKKIGMTQVFTKEGKLIPVTVIEVEPNVVTQIKTVEKDGYDAIQLGTDSIREGLSNKPKMGHTKKAKGFQGVIKRHNQHTGPMGHGSQYHRGVGSLGTMLPMHVLKGKKMPGQMGNVQRTVQNLEIVSIDTENNVILVKGNVPGPKKSLVMIRTAVKNPDGKNAASDLVSYIEVIETPVEENNEVVEETVEETPVEEVAEETATEEQTTTEE